MERETLLVSIFAAILASNGLWALIAQLVSRCSRTKNAQTQMLVGLGHDRICLLGETYLRRGYITREEYENLSDALYAPYRALGGNGTADKIMREVEKLPIQEE